MRAKMLFEDFFSIYLSGGLVKSLEGNSGDFDTPEKLLLLGYEQFGVEEEHSLFEKYYAVNKRKGFVFKVYFYKKKPWTSAICFFGFKLDFVLSLARSYLKKIDVFFDDSKFDGGVLVINDICVCRFDFIKNKYPKIITLETNVTENEVIKIGKTKIEIISSQLLRIESDTPLRRRRNIRNLFGVIEKYCRANK